MILELLLGLYLMIAAATFGVIFAIESPADESKEYVGVFIFCLVWPFLLLAGIVHR